MELILDQILGPCESNPCGTSQVCAYSSTPVDGKYYTCAGTVDLFIKIYIKSCDKALVECCYHS